MDGSNWEVIIKNDMQLYNEFKRRNPHFWNEASQLQGMGEVATLDSIILNFIKKHKNEPRLMDRLVGVAESYLFKDY
ncbi:MAG: hypothetical protein GOVbin1753_14 [Prokaryotic dsDNA virus sp.]|nr:MAG: hypothetical protein GOVbin1753_14 [Prokaryotic dsDNA virus sp.]|tara:strand:- start:550 stop:780 length:231 start_codon:yes stop_codon:yes gene_type:complete